MAEVAKTEKSPEEKAVEQAQKDQEKALKEREKTIEDVVKILDERRKKFGNADLKEVFTEIGIRASNLGEPAAGADMTGQGTLSTKK